ncbi:MAG: lysoplasmalogenase, partial [Rhodoferax sp.]|nr:lysoplasmalogenase [Rhodoferax sp.]
KNYGGILIVWDRLFGSFQEENEHDPCVYGTRGGLNSWDPIWANLEVYAKLLRDAWHTRSWSDKVKVWLMPPGWQPPDLAHSRPLPRFALDQVTRYDPPLSPAQHAFAAVQFVLSLAAVSFFLWTADTLTWGQAAIWVAALSTHLWALGLFMQGRLHAMELLTALCGTLATLAALGMIDGYMVFKPLTMVCALVFVGVRARRAGAVGRFDTTLILALCFSLVGDVFLMLPGNYFIPGLASFLVAHIFYIALFHQGHTWFPSRRALVAVFAVGLVMLGVVWPGLADPVLKIAVTAYVAIISLMASQAIGRATVLAHASARWVAVGACIFMLSDSLIAINKFVSPLPLASLWILWTYYTAQMLMVHHARPPVSHP